MRVRFLRLGRLLWLRLMVLRLVVLLLTMILTRVTLLLRRVLLWLWLRSRCNRLRRGCRGIGGRGLQARVMAMVRHVAMMIAIAVFSTAAALASAMAIVTRAILHRIGEAFERAMRNLSARQLLDGFDAFQILR